MREQRDGSFFDDKHAVMEHGSAEPGVRRCCYAEQATVIESAIPAGAVVVDVGCGPALPYRRAKSWTLIGVDLSYESLRANTEVDIPVYGSAADLPLADHSVDAIVSLYAIHHFGGQTRRENESRVARGFAEFGRVLKPGGSLFIFELSPWWPVWQAQCAYLEPRAQAHAEHGHLLLARAPARERSGRTPRALHDAAPRPVSCASPDAHPPGVRVPGLKIPRFLFPFHVHLYHWTV